MKVQDIKLAKGRTEVVQVTVTDINNWDGLTSKLFVSENYNGVILCELVGVIDSQANTITFTFTKENTLNLINNRYLYEVVLFNADQTFLKTTTMGVILVEQVVKEIIS